MTATPVASAHPKTDWSGKKFGAPSPVIFTKSWRIKHGSITLPLSDGVTATMLGQDSITASLCTHGLPVYAGYLNGSFANLNSFRADFPSAQYILAISPDGENGARCVDCEPGDASVAAAARFVRDNLPETPPAQGRNDQGKPMVYCSAGDSQAVVNAVSSLGITRSEWLLFSAHWIGLHVCAPAGCGFPAADATQYASGSDFDSDVFYAYCFGTAPAPSAWVFKPAGALTLDGAGPHSVKFHFIAESQVHTGLVKFEVVICKGDKLGAVIAGYPRYITLEPGVERVVYTEQYGGVDPDTAYVLAVRGMEQDGSHASPWAMFHFQTAPEA